jgi:hypothetical protein
VLAAGAPSASSPAQPLVHVLLDLFPLTADPA